MISIDAEMLALACSCKMSQTVLLTRIQNPFAAAGAIVVSMRNSQTHVCFNYLLRVTVLMSPKDRKH